VCSPGTTQTQPCAYCGDQVRTCTASCDWGGWDTGACTGVCTPDDYDERPCGICGIRERWCGPDCFWDPFGICDDPCGGGGV